MAARATYAPTQIRNVALIGHRSSGKTSLAEAILAIAGAVRAPGSVTAGTALLDFDDVERRKQQSLQTGFAWVEWGGGLLQILDTPGLNALAYERLLGISVAEVAIVVVDAGEDLGAAAELAFADSLQRGVPTMVFVNKLDRPHDLGAVLESLQSAAGDRRVVPVEAPVGEGGQCTGVVDLLTGAVDMKEGAEPFSGMQSWMTRFAEQLTESVALTDDALLEHYLEYLEVPPERLQAALAKAVGRGEIVPVLFGSATNGYGVHRLLDFVAAYAPTAASRKGPTAFEYDGTPVELGPEGPLVAQLVATQLDADGQPYHVLRVWQGEAKPNQTWVNADTGESGRIRKLYKLRGPRRAAASNTCAGSLVATWDPLPGRPGACFNTGPKLLVPAPDVPPSMMAYALFPKSDRDARRLQEALNQLLSMDGSLELHTDETTGRLLLRGFSDAHLDLALERLHSRLGVDVHADLPPIPYREIPARVVNGVSGVHRKEDNHGLPVEFGACQVDVAPLSPDEGVGFEDAHPDPEELPRKFRPAIDEGVRRALEHGPTAGYPVLGAAVRLTGGEYDILQSTEDHFRIAGEIATRSALEQAGTHILEPWWQVDVYARGNEVGHVIAEISSRRGRIVGLEVLGAETRVCAHMPYRDLRTFGPRLQGATSGRGRFYGEFSHYEPAPDHILTEAIADSPFRHAS
ncbi:MAG: 50S ribosome-binding GTPase [Alphaproteobacteria bacterium]|nr:50S ribosome-binding GTPase [Alphaproteobacteria bacterium]